MKKLMHLGMNNKNFHIKKSGLISNCFLRYCSNYSQNKNKLSKVSTRVKSPSLLTFKSSLNSMLSITERISAILATITGTLLLIGWLIEDDLYFSTYYYIYVYQIQPILIWLFFISILGHLLTLFLRFVFIKKDYK
jgi:hypothetical protein